MEERAIQGRERGSGPSPRGGSLRGGSIAARRILERSQTAGEDAYAEASYDLALANFRLSRTLWSSGAAEEALSPLADARGRFQKLGEAGNEAAENMASVCVSETGICLQVLGRLDEASKAYETSIKFAEKLGDRRGTASAAFQLGAVRMYQRRFDDALGVYTEARATFEALGESGSVASVWHQIGRVYEECSQFEAAEEARWRHSERHRATYPASRK